MTSGGGGEWKGHYILQNWERKTKHLYINNPSCFSFSETKFWRAKSQKFGSSVKCVAFHFILFLFLFCCCDCVFVRIFPFRLHVLLATQGAIVSIQYPKDKFNKLIHDSTFHFVEKYKALRKVNKFAQVCISKQEPINLKSFRYFRIIWDDDDDDNDEGIYDDGSSV